MRTKRKYKRKHSEADIDKAIQLWLAGEKVIYISVITSIPESTLRYHFRVAGLKRVWRARNPDLPNTSDRQKYHRAYYRLNRHRWVNHYWLKNQDKRWAQDQARVEAQVN